MLRNTKMEQAQRIQKQIKEIFGDTPVNLVGGSVRDIILGKEPKDWDYCTPLTPDEIEEKVKAAGRKPYLTGKRFGTVGFKVEVLSEDEYEVTAITGDKYIGPVKEWVYIEVTTYRTEKYDGVSRKPDVDFTDDLMLDLLRRDFTINSIVLQEDGTYFDPHGGRLDILAKKIKAVGKGKDRILEDPLRMLRAARFAARLGFEVDPNLIGVMRQYAYEITRVSKERWVAEIDKLLDSEDPMSGIEVLYKTELLKYVLPELYATFKFDGNFILDVTEGISNAKTLDEKWKAFLSPIGVPLSYNGKTAPKHEVLRREMLQGICLRLKFSNDRTANLLQ